MEPKGQDGIQAYASILHGLKEAMERLLACYCLKYYGREVASINEISMGGGAKNDDCKAVFGKGRTGRGRV